VSRYRVRLYTSIGSAPPWDTAPRRGLNAPRTGDFARLIPGRDTKPRRPELETLAIHWLNTQPDFVNAEDLKNARKEAEEALEYYRKL